jgi:hypothetical protein
MNELCLAKKFGKEIIFFINQDISSMKQEIMTKKVIKEVGFYMGDSAYYTKEDQLLEVVKTALEKHEV